jgi:hypothetical protein
MRCFSLAALLGIVLASTPQAQADNGDHEEARPLPVCDGSGTAYQVLRAAKVRIHQNGTTGYGGGDHPDRSVKLCVEGPHHECWPLRNGAAMNDVTNKVVGLGDLLVLWHDEGGGGEQVKGTNCSASTNYASFAQGGTGASFNIEIDER